MNAKEKQEPGRGRGRPATGATPPRSVKVPDDEWTAWKIAAEKSGAGSLSEWMRAVLNRAAARIK